MKTYDHVMYGTNFILINENTIDELLPDKLLEKYFCWEYYDGTNEMIFIGMNPFEVKPSKIEKEMKKDFDIDIFNFKYMFINEGK